MLTVWFEKFANANTFADPVFAMFLFFGVFLLYKKGFSDSAPLWVPPRWSLIFLSGIKAPLFANFFIAKGCF
jgi:hypothetical protein